VSHDRFTCGTCRFFHRGSCFQSPPVVLADGRTARPQVAADDPRCGAYQIADEVLYERMQARATAPAAPEGYPRRPAGKGWRKGRTGALWLQDQRRRAKGGAS